MSASFGGGTSVNSIPFESWMDVDIRSETTEELNKAVNTFTRLMREAVDEENRARSTSQGRVEVDVKLIGDRPFGQMANELSHCPDRRRCRSKLLE